LEDVRDVAPPERRPPPEHQLRLLRASTRGEYRDESDAEAAQVPDGLGIGSGSDIVTQDGSTAGAERTQ
jgi:hypothetical protein